MRRVLATHVGLALLCAALRLSAAEPAVTRVLVPQLAQGAVAEIEPLLRARAGGAMQVEYLPMPALVERLNAGDTADVAIISRANAQQLAARGRVRSQADLVQSELGVAVPDGAPAPVLNTAEDFVAFLRTTKSIALFAGTAGSGGQVRQFAGKHGLLPALERKTVPVTEGFAATWVLEGKAASAAQQISELRFAGATNIVPLPEAAQNRGITAVVALAGAGNPDVADRIVAALTTPQAAAAYRRTGLAPAFGPPVKVLAPMALRGALEELAPLLRSRAGAPVAQEFMPMTQLVARLQQNERAGTGVVAEADVVIVSKPAAQQLAAGGRVAWQAEVVESRVGIALADGRPLPKMQSEADLLAFLRATPSIALFDGGGSGGLITQFAASHGLAQELARKTVRVTEGYASEQVRDGKAASAVQQLGELYYGGTKNVVPLPESVQAPSVNVVVVLNGAAQADAAERLAKALTSPQAVPAYRAAGLTPVFR